MNAPTSAPARLFVRGGALGEGIEWAFWLGALVWWIDELDLSPLQLVLLGTALETTILLSETPTGVIADQFSRKWSIVLAHTLMGIAFMWSVASRDFLVILPAQVLFGFAWTFKSGADVAWVTDEVRGHQRTPADHPDADDPGSDDPGGDDPGSDHAIEQLILRRHRFGIVAAMGCVLIMMILGVQSIRLAMVVTGVAKLGQALWYAIAMTEHYFAPQHESSSFRETLSEGLAVVKRTSSLKILMATVVLLDFSGEVLDRFAFMRFIDALSVDQNSVVAMGVLFLVLAVAGIAVNAVVSRTLQHRNGQPSERTAVVNVAIVLLLVAAVGVVVIAVSAVPVIIGIGLMFQDATRESLDPVISSWTNREAPSNVRATVHSLIGQSIAIGGISGGLLLGVVAEKFGIPPTLMITAALIVLAAGVASRSRKQPAFT